MFPGVPVEVTVNAWNGWIEPGGILELPNWLIVVAAGGVTLLAWLKAASLWNVPTAAIFALPTYGVLHVGAAMILLAMDKDATPGVGGILTIFAFIGMGVVLIKGRIWLIEYPDTNSSETP